MCNVLHNIEVISCEVTKHYLRILQNTSMVQIGYVITKALALKRWITVQEVDGVRI